MAEQTDLPSDQSSTATTPNSPEDTLNKKLLVTGLPGFTAYPNGDFQTYPIVYPALIPGVTMSLQSQDQPNRGAGIYAVPVPPFMGQISGLPSNTLIPLTYNVPTTRSNSDAGAASDHGQGAQQQQQHQQQQQQQNQQPAPQRQVVARRFQIAFQLDLLLILKLAAVIFLFNQDGSRQRLLVLVFFASLVYLYQTGALTPLVRWLSQSMQRAAEPPRPPRPVRADNAPPVARPNENVALAEGQPVAENENHPREDANQIVENENMAEPGRGDGGNRWWVIVKEIQMIVFGFITSLLPGFHNID